LDDDSIPLRVPGRLAKTDDTLYENVQGVSFGACVLWVADPL
jgi:hypothetical protein